MRVYFNFIRYFIKENPYRVITFFVCLVLLLFTLNTTIRDDYEYYIHSKFRDGGKIVYVVQEEHDVNTDQSIYKIKSYFESDTPDIKGNILYQNKYTNRFLILLVSTSFLCVVFFISVFVEEWNINDILKKTLINEVEKHKDIDYIYYVLFGKVIYKVPNEEDGQYSTSSHSIESSIDNWISNPNLLDDFKGTLVQRRERGIDEILN